jgi:glycosyltransferase involved in cell wall biosynthesis
MRVDVIVTTYNRAAMLEAALRSLLHQELGDLSVDIIVVDNGSTDETRNVVDRLPVPPPLSLRYVVEREKGVAHARNRGLRESIAEWIAFLDDDEIADPEWLQELTTAALGVDAACVGGRVALDEHALVRPLRPFCRALLGETPGGDGPRPFQGKALPGTGNVLVHRTALDAVGRFDASLVHGAEDSDFFGRLRDAGLPAWYHPRARIVHRVPPYRTTPEYLLWVARRHGASSATLDLKRHGRRRVIRDALLRAGQAIAITLPALMLAMLSGNAGLRLEWRCRLARAIGYERHALRLLAPRAFPQRAFEDRLELRAEGERFRREGAAAP